MSDAPQGPGWWLASDGRWYPPESRATPPPPAGPPVTTAGAPLAPPTVPAGPPSVPPGPYPAYPIAPGYGPGPYATAAPRHASGGLGGTIQGFMWASAAGSAVAAVLALVSLGMFNRYWDTPINSRVEADAYDDWIAVDDGFVTVVGLSALSAFVVWILLMIWMNQAHKATQQLWYGPRQWSSGWTVGAWFIPMANAVIPWLVMSEIDRIGRAPRTAGRVDASWRGSSALAVGKVWWILLVVGLVASGVGDAIGTAEDATAGEVRAGYVVQAIGFAILAASGICGALYVRRLASRLGADGMRQQP